MVYITFGGGVQNTSTQAHLVWGSLRSRGMHCAMLCIRLFVFCYQNAAVCVCAYMLSDFSHVNSVTAWTLVCQAPPFVGFSKQEYWSGLPCHPPGDLPDPGTEPTFLKLPVSAGRFFTTSTIIFDCICNRNT